VLKRYVLFGNLFAGVGGATYRLDRHPTMSRHPITPMTESDLRRHLALQTTKAVGLVDLLALGGAQDELDCTIAGLRADGTEIILFDTLDEPHLRVIGRVLWDASSEAPLFVVGSSGVEYALTRYLQADGRLQPSPSRAAPEVVAQMVVMAGSAAPTTASQIAYAEAHGSVGIRLDAAGLIDPAHAPVLVESAELQALAALESGASVVLYAARGPDDPALIETRQRAAQLGLAEHEVGPCLARAQGELMGRIVAGSGLRRVCVAGGDTSGYVARALGIYALEMVAPIAPGAPLCRAYSSVPAFDGLEISLKGGQNGQADFFERLRQGGR
jgi:3-oxoisoapionate kinase